MKRVGLSLLVFLVGFDSRLLAAESPVGYLEMSALEKRAFHASKVNSGYRLPMLPIRACSQGVAALGFISKRYIREAIESPSGYAVKGWRKYFGRAIHRDGVKAPGRVELHEPLLGLAAGGHPVTYRYSLANPYNPHIPGMAFRPGLLIMFHQDGKKDVNVFLMPPNGLDGFPTEVNPFRVLTPWLDKPKSLSVRMLAAATFQRAVGNVFTQFIDPPVNVESETTDRQRVGSARLELQPFDYWVDAYSRSQGKNFFDRLRSLEVQKGAIPMFSLIIADKNGTRTVGRASLSGNWEFPSDIWFAQHEGFDLL